MAPLAWMTAGSILSWAALAAAGGARVNPEVLFGMLAPLGSAGLSWMAVRRAHAAAPERLMGVLIRGFAMKLVFFVAYVTVMLRGLELRPVPFVLSFVGYLIALYAAQALFLKRLIAAR